MFVKNTQMKNVVIVDVDTEREPKIMISKPDAEPTTIREVKKMLLTDVESLAEGLLSLIHTMVLNGFESRENLLHTINTKIKSYTQLHP